jgi:hypothetical protein
MIIDQPYLHTSFISTLLSTSFAARGTPLEMFDSKPLDLKTRLLPRSRDDDRFFNPIRFKEMFTCGFHVSEIVKIIFREKSRLHAMETKFGYRPELEATRQVPQHALKPRPLHEGETPILERNFKTWATPPSGNGNIFTSPTGIAHNPRSETKSTYPHPSQSRASQQPYRFPNCPWTWGSEDSSATTLQERTVKDHARSLRRPLRTGDSRENEIEAAGSERVS